MLLPSVQSAVTPLLSGLLRHVFEHFVVLVVLLHDARLVTQAETYVLEKFDRSRFLRIELEGQFQRSDRLGIHGIDGSQRLVVLVLAIVLTGIHLLVHLVTLLDVEKPQVEMGAEILRHQFGRLGEGLD